MRHRPSEEGSISLVASTPARSRARNTRFASPSSSPTSRGTAHPGSASAIPSAAAARNRARRNLTAVLMEPLFGTRRRDKQNGFPCPLLRSPGGGATGISVSSRALGWGASHPAVPEPSWSRAVRGAFAGLNRTPRRPGHRAAGQAIASGRQRRRAPDASPRPNTTQGISQRTRRERAREPACGTSLASPFTDALSTLNDRALRRMLGARAYLRGYDYVRRHAVSDIAFDEAGARGQVRGTDADPYRAGIPLSPHGLPSTGTVPA